MAIAVKTQNDVDILLGEQATWGTVLADTADFNATTPEFGEIVDCEPTGLDYDVKVRLPNRSNSGARYLITDNIQHDQKGSAPKITLRGDAKKRTLAALLYATIQNVSEDAAAGVFLKTFSFGSTQPDFTANGGWFGTLIVKQGSSQSQKIRDVICRKLTLTGESGNNQGRMQMEAELIGRGAPTLTSNPNTGALARHAQAFYYFEDIAICSGAGSTLYPISYKVEITNNAIPVSVSPGGTSGDFLTFALPKYEVKMTLKVLWDSNAKTIQDTIIGTTDGSWRLTWGTNDTDGYLDILVNGQPGPAPDLNEELKTIEFTVTGVYDGTNAPLTLEIGDGLDRAW